MDKNVQCVAECAAYELVGSVSGKDFCYHNDVCGDGKRYTPGL